MTMFTIFSSFSARANIPVAWWEGLWVLRVGPMSSSSSWSNRADCWLHWFPWSFLAIRLCQPSFLVDPFDFILCPQRCNVCKSLLVCLHRSVPGRMSLMSLSLFLQLSPAYFARFIRMLCEMAGRWSYSFVVCWFQDFCSKQNIKLLCSCHLGFLQGFFRKNSASATIQ